MRTNYRATADPAKTIVAGSSLGGLAAAFTAFEHPDVFGKVLSQSGSYWWAPAGAAQGEWLTHQLQQTKLLPIEFFMEVGQMENSDERDSNQHLRGVLEGKGYVVHYQEYNGGHTPLSWRGSFADGLAALAAR
jgi:enterochelin esterase family protein